jgi:hypothetical protein
MNSRQPHRWGALALGAIGLVSACAPSAPKEPRPSASTGPVSNKISSAKERQTLSITVYNQNFGLVREIRDLSLGSGRVSLEYGDVSGHIQPETVHIKALARGPGDEHALDVLEQNYRYDLLQPRTLLDKYVGKKIKVYRYNEQLGREEPFDAEVLSANDAGTVLRINGEVTYDFPGRFAFPGVPANLIAKPTLVWLLQSGKAEQRVEVTYLTQNLNWSADYVLVVDAEDRTGDLTGWVTLVNNTGTSYQDASLKLVAGDVQRVAPTDISSVERTLARADAGGEGRGFKEEGFFEYHLYTLERPTSVLDKEQKQVTLLEGRGAGVVKKLILPGQEYWYRGRYGQVVSNQKVGVFLDIQNSEKNHLGMPLPKGVVRVYKADSTGAKQFIGEDQIDHTPRDEKIRVKMGEAFDVVGDRKQTEWTSLGSCTSESAWEISLRNHKDAAEHVEVMEPVGGDWEVTTASHPWVKQDSRTFSFDVQVPARGETKITYRVRVRWC